MTRHPGRRAALLAGIGGVLTGCGFHPVYMASGNGPGPETGLAAIEVKPIYGRPGQILREALLSRLRIEPGAKRQFDLDVGFWISGEAIGILNFTQSSRVRMIGYANWKLLNHDTRQTKLTEGSDRLVDGVDLFGSEYFALDMDVEKVQRRLAEAMAEQISLRLAMWFHEHPAAVG